MAEEETHYITDKESNHYLTINNCGHDYITKKLSNCRLYGRLDYQIIYIVKGKGHFNFNDKETIAEMGDIVLFRPHEPQIYYYLPEDETEVFWIHFTGSGVKELLPVFPHNKFPVLHVGTEENFSNCFYNIFKEYHIKSNCYNMFCNGYLMTLFACIFRHEIYTQSKDNNSKYEKILPAIENICNHYQQNRTIDEYSAMCTMSKYYFSHLFKEYTGLTPLAYRCDIRLEKAKYYLCNSNMLISEISEAIGFFDPLYFSKLFHDKTGVSPTEYRSHKQP